jgi:hypothetical protein
MADSLEQVPVQDQKEKEAAEQRSSEKDDSDKARREGSPDIHTMALDADDKALRPKVTSMPSQEGNLGNDAGNEKGDDKKKAAAKSGATKADKLKYLEEKYKEVFKECTLRKEESAKLALLIKKLMRTIDAPETDAEEYRFGTTTAIEGAVEEAVAKYKRKIENERTNQESILSEKVKEFEESISKKYSDLAKRKEEEFKNARVKFDEQVLSLDQAKVRLQKDNSDLLVILKMKDNEVAELKKINESLTAQANDPLMQRFDAIQSPMGGKQADLSSTLDEMIRLRNELDEAYNKIDLLEEQITNISRRSPVRQSSLNGSEETAGQISPKKANGFSISTQTDHSDLKPAPEALETKLERMNSLKKAGDEDEESSKSYLKNLIIRYMVYEAKRNEAECVIIRRAILDYLGVASEERATIDDAVNNRGGLKDAVYFFKLFGSQG